MSGARVLSAHGWDTCTAAAVAGDDLIPRQPPDSQPVRPDVLTYEDLRRIARTRPPALVADLLPDRSLTALIGDSGLAKTALMLQLATCVAAGVPFLGRTIAERGDVLYADFESGVDELIAMLRALAAFVDVSDPPANLKIWSPAADTSGSPIDGSTVEHLAKQHRPRLVVVDSLRAAYPMATEGNAESLVLIRRWRGIIRETGCSVLFVHHTRKRNPKFPLSLEADRHAWFDEASGAKGFINGIDARYGVERTTRHGADLLMAGFRRSVGFLEPIFLQKQLDDDGEPQGFRQLTGISLLHPNYQETPGCRRAVPSVVADLREGTIGSRGHRTCRRGIRRPGVTQNNVTK